MEKLTPKILQQLHPECFWAVYRMAREEVLNDPAVKRQLAEEYLRSSHMEASPVAPREASPQPQGVQISAEQAAVNKQLGIGVEEFNKFANGR